MRTKNLDPRYTFAYFRSKCGKSIKKDERIIYFPASKAVFCTECGKPEYQQFLSSIADEQVYNGTGNPYCY